MSEGQLCIGESMDGMVVVTDCCKWLDFPIPGKGGFGRQRYRRETLLSGERQHIIYVVDDIPGADIIGRLIAGYGMRREE
jgi:hypothetical protein